MMIKLRIFLLIYVAVDMCGRGCRCGMAYVQCLLVYQSDARWILVFSPLWNICRLKHDICGKLTKVRVNRKYSAERKFRKHCSILSIRQNFRMGGVKIEAPSAVGCGEGSPLPEKFCIFCIKITRLWCTLNNSAQNGSFCNVTMAYRKSYFYAWPALMSMAFR